LKLAIIIPGFQADERDWCIPAFTNLAQELAKSVELHVFALRYPHSRRSYRIGPVRVHAFGGSAISGRRVPGVGVLKLWRDALAAIEREHKRGKFSAIIGVWATESGWLATRAARRLGVPSLVHLAGGELVNLPDIKYGNQAPGLSRLLVSRTLRRADALTVPSAPQEQALRARRDVDGSKIRRWSLGVDTQMFAPDTQLETRTEASPFTFITVGSLIPVKGHEWLVRGAAALRETAPDVPFRLQIVGTGPLLPHLQAQARQLDLADYVNFLGDVRHEALPAVLRQADCFLLGSYHEAQCMAALEAMACGLPWIAPPVGALVDCARIEPGETPSGILLRDRSVQALADVMYTIMLASLDERRAMGDAARRRVERDYFLQTQTARLLDLVAKVDTLPLG